jgi:hypothetical protein
LRTCQAGLPITCLTRIHLVTQEMALRTYVGIEAIMKNEMRRQYISLNSLRKIMKVTLIHRI